MIDIHVHMVGNGKSGSGCFLQARGFSRINSILMLQGLGLSRTALSNDLESIYADRLASLVRESSLSKVVLLANDWAYDNSGCALKERAALFVPNDFVIEMSRKYPEFLAGISIHPARADAIDELDRLADSGASLLKCLPNCQNIDCMDKRYRPFWRKMAELRLPLLAHTGGELSLPVLNRSYENPEILRGPLEEGVTVIAAHMATSSYPGVKDYFFGLCKLFEQFPNLYGDLSALSSPFRSKHLTDCLADERVLARLVHGSDVPIPVSSLWPALRGMIGWSDYLRLRQISNPIELDYQIKVALGFPSEIFNRAYLLLRSSS